MSILSRFTYFLEVKQNIFLQAFEFERRIEDPELQVDALLEILSRFTYFLEVKQNIFLQAFEFERRIEDPELQVDVLLETSSAKMKTRNRGAI